MNQNSISSSLSVCISTAKSLIHTPPSDQRLNSGNNIKVRVTLGVFTSSDLPTKLVDISKRLVFTIDEGVGFGEDLVFKTHTSNAAALQFPDETTSVVEVTITGITINENGNMGPVGHEFQNFQNLRPGGFIVITNTKGSTHGQPRSPNTIEPSLFDNLGRQTIVSFHDEFKTRRGQKVAQPESFAGQSLRSVEMLLCEVVGGDDVLIVGSQQGGSWGQQ
mmetsp:Transcript_104/g.219  ORF Transcript_104/g.219 Transcript_104/m.219 type:complete len:220 (-) Transcript_104:11-670(-)